jgi:CRISPR-associated exonuclease Cas4
MYAIDDLLPLSALQHVAFCERQCALICTEQVWAENRLTVEGKILHERVREESRKSRGDVRIDYGVSLRSLRLGLIGKADVVEFHRQQDGAWLSFPVEYKRGKPKADIPY